MEAIRIIGSGRSCGSTTFDGNCLSIISLPESILRFVGGYLPNSSRAIMASALSRSACFESDTLDFSDIGRDLASELTDSDISSILVSIDAVNTLKVLKLIGCTNITGVGLDPLRGSTILEQIDMSTSEKGAAMNGEDLFSPNFPWGISLSEDDVIPILDSIIAEKDRALRHVQFPLAWRQKKCQILSSFLERYNLAITRLTCAKCSACRCGCTTCREEFRNMNTSSKTWEWGLQNFTCYDCLKYFCEDCEEDFCDKCQKKFCESCCPTQYCEHCGKTSCTDCHQIFSCESCSGTFCQDCLPVCTCECCNRTRCMDCMPYYTCEGCQKSNCGDCAHENNVQDCEFCFEENCNDCRLKAYNEGNLACSGCRALLLPWIMQEKDAALQEKEAALQEKEAALLKKNIAIRQKNAAIREKQDVVEENASLRKKLGESLQLSEDDIQLYMIRAGCPPEIAYTAAEEMKKDKVITITLKDDRSGEEIAVIMWEKSTTMRRMFKAYADRENIDVGSICFKLDGKVIHPDDTAAMIGLEDNGVIECVWPKF
eukprot:scaffold15599_cov129-Skeletonema_dohrnii-CCMP3373.AAC.5